MASVGAKIGNDNAVKNRLFRDTIDRAIKQDDGKRLRATVEKLLDSSAAGEQWAVALLADRLDGKAAQQVIHSGDAENPVEIVERPKLTADQWMLAHKVGQ